MVDGMTTKKNPDVPKLGWQVTPETVDAFKVFCDKAGVRYQDAASGALFLWMYMPAEIREWAMLAGKGDSESPDEDFWEGFRRAFAAKANELRAGLPDKKDSGRK